MDGMSLMSRRRGDRVRACVRQHLLQCSGSPRRGERVGSCKLASEGRRRRRADIAPPAETEWG